MNAGRLILVGAGPGDPELLTLRAVRALGEADVVLVDDLVDRRVLAHVRRGARIVAVGKRGGCRSTPQSYIERLIVREARAGHVVVRLKGGDPFIFGRGGEEQEAAIAAGVPCEVIPGITAAIAAAAQSGVPLTHRECTPGVVLVTGHSASDRPIDWRALVATRMTLVVYMGVTNVAAIEAGLRTAGMPSSTPIAIVERASHGDARTTLATLADLATTVACARVRGPAILIIGDVAGRGVLARVERLQRLGDLDPLRFEARESPGEVAGFG